MIKNTISIDETIAYLNELLKIDRQAISEVFFHRARCNASLAEHDRCQVMQSPFTGPDDPPVHHVRPIGILSGLFGVDRNGSGSIAVDVDNSGFITAFVRYRTPTITGQ